MHVSPIPGQSPQAKAICPRQGKGYRAGEDSSHVPRRHVSALSSVERRAQRRAPPPRDRPGRSPDVDSSFGQRHRPLQPPEADLCSSELEPGDRGHGRRRLNLQGCRPPPLRRRFQREGQEKGRRAESAGQGQRQQQRWQAQSAERRVTSVVFSQGKNPERETPPLQWQRQRETKVRTLPSGDVVQERQDAEMTGRTTTSRGDGVTRHNFATRNKISYCNSTNSVVLSVENGRGGHQTRECISSPFRER